MLRYAIDGRIIYDTRWWNTRRAGTFAAFADVTLDAVGYYFSRRRRLDTIFALRRDSRRLLSALPLAARVVGQYAVEMAGDLLGACA